MKRDVQVVRVVSFYEGVGVRDLKIEESEVLCTNSTALVPVSVNSQCTILWMLKDTIISLFTMEQMCMTMWCGGDGLFL
jgi:hypothetical protein